MSSPRRDGTESAPCRGAVAGLKKSLGCTGASVPPLLKLSKMGHYFIPWNPMDSVMRLCSDLQQNETPFQLSVKIVGSVDFHLSTMPSQQDENVNHRSGGSWHHRGPSYLRRQLKRSLEKKSRKSQESCDDEMTSWGSGGNSSTTPTKKTYVPAENAAQTFVPEQPKMMNNVPEVGVAPNLDGGAARELEVGGGEMESVAREKGKSETQCRLDLVDQMKKTREEMKIQKKILRGCMSIISENLFPIYNLDHGAHHFYANVEHTDSYIDKCRKDFGLPSVTTEREWQMNSCDDDEGMDTPLKISQQLQSCWSPDDICLICNQRKPRFCSVTQIKHDCNLRYDDELNKFVPK